MKKLLPAILFFLAICQLSAQVLFNKAYHSLDERPEPFVIKIHNDLYFTTQREDVYKFSDHVLYKHNSSGNLVYRKDLNSTIFSNLGYKSFDDKIILVGHSSPCPGEIIVPNICLSKLDTNGTALFSATVAVPNNSPNDFPKASIQYSDSSYMIFTDSLLFNFSKTGQFLSKINFGFKNISSALLLANNTVLISGDQGSSHRLAQISNTGTVLTSSLTSVLFQQLSFYGGQKIVALGKDGKFYKFSANMNLISSSSFTGGLLATNFICKQDTIYSLSTQPLLGQSYMIADTSFNTISLTTTTTHSVNQLALCLNGTRMAILSSGLSCINRYHFFASLNVINKFGSNNFTSDISLRSVVVDSMYTSCSSFSLPTVTITNCNTYLRPKFTIKNNGNTVVKQFKLNCFNSDNYNACGVLYNQETFSGLSLQPGDSLTLIAAKFANKLRPFSNTVTATSFPVQYCFYTTLPNGETDKVVEDNELCKSFTFLVTSLKDYSKTEQKISVAPNPFEDSINIQADSEIKQIDVFNTLGMLVKSAEGNDKTITFHNSELQNGIYFLKIETEKGTITKKVLKY